MLIIPKDSIPLAQDLTPYLFVEIKTSHESPLVAVGAVVCKICCYIVILGLTSDEFSGVSWFGLG